MADIFQEVDEDLRQERYARLWKRYGNYVIAVAVLIVLAVAGSKAWTAWQEKQRLELSDRYAVAEAAAAEGDAAGEAAFAALADPKAGDLKLLAAFEAARLADAEGDTARAIAGWKEIAARGVDDGLGAAAAYLAANAAVEAGDAATARPLIEELIAEPDHAFNGLARELRAALALADGDLEAARRDLEAIRQDLGAPAGLSLRAGRLLEALGGGSDG